MSAVRDLLNAHPFCDGMAPEHRDFLARHATEHCVAAGEYFFRCGEPAHRFYLLTRGQVALEIRAPGRAPFTTETLHEGDVLGWSWLMPPCRWLMDARAVAESCVLRCEAEPVREAMAGDPAFALALYQRFLPVLADRLFANRLQLVDLYAHPGGGGEGAAR